MFQRKISKILPAVVLFVIFGFNVDASAWFDGMELWFATLPATGEPIKIPAR